MQMKVFLNSILFTGVLLISACGQPEQNNESASDTASVFDTTRMDSQYDTSAVLDVEAQGPNQAASPGQQNPQIQESHNEQGPRTNVGADTTGKQPHDNLPQ